MSVQSYPFQFVGIDSHTTDALQKDTLIYQFASSKSCHQYIVRIERYVHDLHCVKFLDATNDKSSGRFSYLSATYEPRTIFHTIFNIALDVLRNNRRASFLFIGAADNRDIIGKPTRRYRVYRLLPWQVLSCPLELPSYPLHQACALSRQMMPRQLPRS